MNTQLLADTIACLDKELFDEVIVEHYKRTMEKKTLIAYKYVAVAAAAVLLTVSVVIPLIAYKSTSNETVPTNTEELTTANTTSLIPVPVLTVETSYPKTDHSSFLYVKVVKVYDGVYGDDPTDTTRCVLADLEIIDDIWDHGTRNRIITVQFDVNRRAAEDRSTFLYDDYSLYKEFLTENDTGLIYIFQDEVSPQEKYSFQTGSIERFSDMFFGRCRLSSIKYFPVKNGKLDLDSLKKFTKISAYQIDFDQVFYDGETLEEVVEKIKNFTPNATVSSLGELC